MSKKSSKIAALIKDFECPGLDAHYVGYFDCFNRQDYYEAHDVLEELWLTEGKESPNYAFYKGLIQGAGAFVHLKLHYQFPSHHVHGARLAPAGRLLQRALHHLTPYGNAHLQLDLNPVRKLWQQTHQSLEQSDFQRNPWHPETAPGLHLIVT
jgi:predicted metal-dependent hydrolase